MVFLGYGLFYLISLEIDGAFSISTRLELAGVVGLVRRAGSIFNLHRRGGPTKECWPSLRYLSQFLSHERERDQLLIFL